MLMQYCFVFISNYFLVITVLAYNQFSSSVASFYQEIKLHVYTINEVTIHGEKWYLARLVTRKYDLESFFFNNLVIAFECFISDFEIPDDDAERLMTPALIIEYICDKEDTYE